MTKTNLKKKINFDSFYRYLGVRVGLDIQQKTIDDFFYFWTTYRAAGKVAVQRVPFRLIVIRCLNMDENNKLFYFSS